MLNNIVLVGRIVNDMVLETNKKGKEYCEIKLAVNRNYKNEEGICETDFIPVVMYGNVANNTIKYCDKGDLIGVKGRVETNFYMYDTTKMVVVANQVSFLSSKKVESEEE